MIKRYRNYLIAFIAIITIFVTVCFIPINATKLIPIIEKQAAEDFGIKVHIERLILRLGPSLKVKTPVMHIMYEDGQKFAQFNNVKFYIPWTSLFKDDVAIKKIYASDLIIKQYSPLDKYLSDVIKKFEERNFQDNPNVFIKKYSITYYDGEVNKNYGIKGSNLVLDKILAYKNYKLAANGEFAVNEKSYLTYDISLVPNFDMLNFSDLEINNVKEFIEQLETLDFHSDVIADLKINKTNDGNKEISGLVNIDNISVSDPAKKNPKSFIYLTFLGNKIGILSNIYTSIDKKICLDGVVNHSKKPEIDIKVKTDEIDLASFYTKIKLLIDYSYFKEINSLSGKMIADFNLKGDLNKIKSTGFLKISDAAIKASGVDINNVQSEIDFSNNTINIVNAIGYVNKAPILAKGKIDKNIDVDLLMDKVELKHLLPQKTGIQSGIMSLTANLSGTLDNVVHKENVLIDNFKVAENGNSLTFDSLKFNSNKENNAYISNLVIKPQKTEFIKLPMLKFNIGKDLITVSDTNVFMPNSKLKANAEISDYNTKDITFNIKINGFINSRDLKNIIPQDSILPVMFNLSGNKTTQNFLAKVLLEKAMFLDEPCLISLDSKIENNSVKIEDLSVYSYTGNLSDSLKLNSKAPKKAVVSGIVEDLTKPVLKNVRIFIPQPLNITIMDTIAQLKGDIFINGKIDKPDVVGQISVQSLVNQFMQLSSNNLTIDFNKNIAVLNAPAVKLADSSLSLNSVISTDFSNGLLIKNLGIKSKYINTDTFLMYKDQLLSNIKTTIEEGKLYSERAMLSIYGSHIYLTALSSDLKLKDNILQLRNISSEVFNGKLVANLDLNVRDEFYKTEIQARGVSACPIFDIVAAKKDTVSGIMDFDTQLTGNLSSKESIDGNIKFEVRNGHIGTLGKLEHLLYAQNVIADNMLRTSLSVITKAITLRDTGLFKYLRGDIVLKNGIADVKMLQSQGPLMSLFIKGQYNPMTDYGKLIVLGRVSDEIMTSLGAFGDMSMNKLMTMLTGEENNKNHLYAVNKEDLEKLPQLPIRNTKEFRSIINGIVEKPSSVVLFNWISYTQKDYRQKTVPAGDAKVPDFINNLPY